MEKNWWKARHSNFRSVGIYGWIDTVDVWMDGWMDGWIDGYDKSTMFVSHCYSDDVFSDERSSF